jgi:5'-3' exonuclease
LRKFEMKILLVDLSSVYWQYWHATKDEPLNSAFELSVKKITRIVDRYDHVGICLDSPPYKRKEISADYKAQRDKPDELAVAQLERVKDRLTLDGFALFSSPGAEADDVIASIVTALDGDDIELVDILTGDKDLTQLVTETVNTISTQTGERYDVANVASKFGVMPEQMHDFLALCGDRADNIPGVQGIGPKKAQELIRVLGPIPEMLNHIDGQTPELASFSSGVVESLFHHADSLKISYELVKLNRGLQLDTQRLFEPRVPKPLTDVGSGFSGHREPPERKQEIIVAEPTKIVKRDEWSRQLEPTTFDGAWMTSEILFNSRLYQAHGNAESIFAIILRGRALGIDATTALDSFHVIQGKPTMSADLMVGLVINSKKARYFKCVETTSEKAVYKTHRKDDPDPEPTPLTFSIEDARKLGLTNKDNWRKQPKTMLRHRCAAALSRLVYPDVVGGLYTPEEIEVHYD